MSRERKRSSRFANRLLSEWKRLALPRDMGERVVVAVSGGADSVALLLAMSELIKEERLPVSLTVAHLDHALRASSCEDARWVENLARELGLDCIIERMEVKRRAESSSDNLEQTARRARYEFLGRACESLKAKVLLTAHTMDDQAETVLLRLMRGSGAEGLGGIEPVRRFSQESELLLARPLLNWARRTLTEGYCRERRVDFRNDEMNEDEGFARVRVRKSLIPLMQSFNGRVVEGLSRTAKLLREDARVLNSLAQKLLEEASQKGLPERGALEVEVLTQAPEALRRRALRQWLGQRRGDLRRLEMVHLLAIERLLCGERGGRVVELPGGAWVERRKGLIFFHLKKVENEGAGD